MTSIVRTYYSFQPPKSSDRTYNLSLMGLWGWAELAIGIIVGCLPVMPKFVQHVGTRFFKTSSPRSRAGVRPAHGLNDPALNANTFTKIQRPFTKDDKSSLWKSSTDSHNPQAGLHGDFPTSFIHDSSTTDALSALEPAQLPGAMVATRRDDLEHGPDDF